MCLFRMDLAIRFGIHAAIIMQFLWEHLKPGVCDERIRKFNNKRWYRCSQKMMSGFLPFLSRSMIQDAMGTLVKQDVIRKGCHNENPFDKTNWYSFTEYGEHLMRGE